MSKERYTKVFDFIWDDENIVQLSDDAKLLYLYVMTCRHGNAAGIFILPKLYIQEDLRWSDKRLQKPFSKLSDMGLILYDEPSRVLVVTTHLKHNKTENPNQIKNVVDLVANLPKSKGYSVFIERLDKPFHKPLREGLNKRLPKPVAVTETVTEAVTVKKDITTREEKSKFLDCVMLKESEHKKLITSFGEQKTKDLIQRLNDYVMSKGKKYSSHYHTILSWERKDGTENGNTPKPDDNYPVDL